MPSRSTAFAYSYNYTSFRDDQFLNLKLKNNCYVWRDLNGSKYQFQFHKPLIISKETGVPQNNNRGMIGNKLEAVVEYEYAAEQEDELTLKVGDIISNVQTAEGGWWEGELNGKKGMFPENFVKLVKRREPGSTKKEEKREATQRKSVRELANKFKDGLPIGGPPKKKEKKKRCKVIFEYKRENDDELDLTVGDIVEFHKQVEEGWWEGTSNGKHGVFPSNFVEMIDDTASSDEGAPGVGEDREKTPDSQPKEDFQTIKGKKVVGVGLGNIFGSGPIKLRSAADKAKKEDGPKPGKPGDSDAAPEVVKREKQSPMAVVRFSYAAEQPDELSLAEGQVVRIIDKELEDEGWWKGEVNGKIGVFPDNFVELLPNEEPNKPKKPPPPSAAGKHNLHHKLADKAPMGDSSDEKIKTEPIAPTVTKKPQAPPPIGKKPLNQSKPEPGIPGRPPGSVKDKTVRSENHTDNRAAEDPAQFDSIEPTGQKLTHLTANRAKGPKKRPPSTVLALNEGEKDGESMEDSNSQVLAPEKHHSHIPEKHQSHVPDKPDKPHPILPPKDNKHQPQPHAEIEPPSSVHSAPSHASHRDREPYVSGAPPPRPPEPTSTPPHSASASSIQTNKLIEQLQREINELKANTVSKAAFNELRAEHEKLKTEFENVKNNHMKKFRDLMNEVDEEKKLRVTTQVEIERVKKFMSETHV